MTNEHKVYKQYFNISDSDWLVADEFIGNSAHTGEQQNQRVTDLSKF